MPNPVATEENSNWIEIKNLIITINVLININTNYKSNRHISLVNKFIYNLKNIISVL